MIMGALKNKNFKVIVRLFDAFNHETHEIFTRKPLKYFVPFVLPLIFVSFVVKKGGLLFLIRNRYIKIKPW